MGDRYAVGTKEPFCLEVCLHPSYTYSLPLSRMLVLARPAMVAQTRDSPDGITVQVVCLCP